jgi:3-hydroxyisobutyrate dehydrogenase-like beta-hydroxyacid dehydrogenase
MTLPSGRRIALLGTGIMGAHMARRLAQAGFAVTAWNRSADKAGKLTPFGVRIADSPSSACADADVVIVMLSNGPVVEEVLFSPDPTGQTPAEAMAAGSVLVVMSSIPVETCQAQAPRLKARGVGYVDAPVSGGEPGARDGTLAIMAGGDATVIDGIGEIFSAMGRVTRIGPVGTGQLAKLANQIIVGATVAGVAEALHFAAKGGADPAALRKALMGGFADSKILNIHGERMVERNFVPGGPAAYQLKDMRTAQALAADAGLHFTVLDCLVGLFGDMIDEFGTGLDVAGIFLEVERRSGGAQADRTKEAT